MASRALGIDLGASTTVLARVDSMGRSAPVRNPQGELLIPSVVYFEEEELVFGRAARQLALTQPAFAAELVKRDRGQPSYTRAIGGELLPTEVIEGCLLHKVCADLAEQTGDQPAVVISAPACFDQARRRALLDAAQIAGIELLGTINDPLATALAFAEVQGYLNTDDKPGCRVLVFDLGGGTLDVSIIEIKPRRLRTMAVGGDPRLGGRDWDAKLAEHLAEAFAKQFEEDPRHDMVSVRRLLAVAEEAKQTLSTRQQARVRVERGKNVADLTVSRAQFENVTADLLERVKKITEEVLARSGVAWRDLSHLLLVGGAARMPMIGEMLEELTQLPVAANLPPDDAVARGAALYAACLLAAREGRAAHTQVEIADLMFHGLGIEWSDPETERAENVVIISRGSELPCGAATKVNTTSAGQQSVTVQILEGNSRRADECTRVATVEISGLPEDLPRQTTIDVHYQVTREGRLQVKAQLGKHTPLKIAVRRSRGLSEEQLGQWRELVARGEGLDAILTLQKSHQPPEPEPEPELPMGQVVAGGAGQPPALPGQGGMLESLDLQTGGESSTLRLRRRGMTPRKIAIMLAGYALSAALGLAIGYYILMRIEPSYNVLNLRLPGLRPAPQTGAVAPGSL